jgi:hypothetical protein
MKTQQKQLISGLKTAIKVKGLAWVTAQLGYRSGNTIMFWFKNGKIPDRTVPSVIALMEKGVR